MSDSDVMMLKGELETLKAVMSEKWSAHDKRSDERWIDLMEQVHEMAKKIDARPCHDHSALMVDLNNRIKTLEQDKKTLSDRLWAILLLVVGAVITSIASIVRN